MTIKATAVRPVVSPRAAAPAPATPAPAPTTPTATPGDLAGLQPDAYAAMAKSFAQAGKQDLADQYTLAAVKGAKSGADALAYATARYGADSSPNGGQWNEYWRSSAPYVASKDAQLQAVTLAAAKFTNFDDAVQALRSAPAQATAANDVMIKRAVDLASDNERIENIMPLIQDLGSPDAVAYAQAATKSKPQVSWWVRLWRGLQESQL